MLRGLLADAEVAEMNAAVDAMTAGQDYSESVMADEKLGDGAPGRPITTVRRTRSLAIF